MNASSGASFGSLANGGSVIHRNRDPVTDTCLDCGATFAYMADFPDEPCHKATGPHRLAIIAGRRDLWDRDRRLREMRARMLAHEDAIARLSREIREAEAEGLELIRSIEMLKQGE